LASARDVGQIPSIADGEKEKDGKKFYWHNL
jgi:hypothetical protein